MPSHRTYRLTLTIITITTVFVLSESIERRCPDGSLAGEDCQLLIPPNNYMCPSDPVHSKCHNFDGHYYCCAYVKPKCYDKAAFCRFTKSLCNDPSYWRLISDECEATCGFCHRQQRFEEIVTTIRTDATKISAMMDNDIANRNVSFDDNINTDGQPIEPIQQNGGGYLLRTNQDPSDNLFSIFPRMNAKKLPGEYGSISALSDGMKSTSTSKHSEGAERTNVSLIQKQPHSGVSITRSEIAEAESLTTNKSKDDIVDENSHQRKVDLIGKTIANNMKQPFEGFNDHSTWDTDNSSTLSNGTHNGRPSFPIGEIPMNISEQKVLENIIDSLTDNVLETSRNSISKHIKNNPSGNIQRNSVGQVGSHDTVTKFFNDLTSQKMNDSSIQKQLPENYKGIKRRAKPSVLNRMPSKESNYSRIAFLNINNANLEKYKMDTAEKLDNIPNGLREQSRNKGPAPMMTTRVSMAASKDVRTEECEDFAENCIERANFCSNAAFTQFMTRFCAKTCNRCDTLI